MLRRVRCDRGEALTREGCGQLVVELVKHLVHHKSQIPYDYGRLKRVVEGRRRRQGEGGEAHRHQRYQSDRHFAVASQALDALDQMFKNIKAQFESEHVPKEVCIVFGASVLCAKEAYRITIPDDLDRHFHGNHLNDPSKLIRKLLRSIYCSEDDASTPFIAQPLPPTNTFIFLKRTHKDVGPSEDYFLPVNAPHFSPRIAQHVIAFDYDPTFANCCKSMKIFADSPSSEGEGGKENRPCNGNTESTPVSKLELKEGQWFRAPVCLKGFEACFVDGQCVSNDWVTT